MSMKLYELSDSYLNVLDLIDEENPDDDILNALKVIEGAIEVKAVSMANLVKSLEAEAKIIKAEEERLFKRRKSRENAVKNIKQYLQNEMEAIGKDKIKTPTRTLSIQANPWKLEITNEESIPDQYFDVIPMQLAPRNDEIKKALTDGIKIPGAALTRGRSLRIR